MIKIYIKKTTKWLLVIFFTITIGLIIGIFLASLNIVNQSFLHLDYRKVPEIVTDIGSRIALSNYYVSKDFYNCIVQGSKIKCWSNYNPVKKEILEIKVNNIEMIQTSNSGIMYNGCILQKDILKCWKKNHKVIPIKILKNNVTKFNLSNWNICAIQKGALKCGGFYIGFNKVNKNIKYNYTENIKLVKGLDSGVTDVSLGLDYACAIQKGALKCWGRNEYGQLGIGTKTTSLVPKLVKGLDSDVTDVSLGLDYACAIQKGALKCWGRNEYGQLGIGTKTTSLVPKLVKGLDSDVTDVSLGLDYACAIQKGALKCWGRNEYGQLGIGTKTTSLVPKLAKGLDSDVTDVKLSRYSTLFKNSCVIQRKSVKCSGNNLYDQIGSSSIKPLYSKLFVSIKHLETDVDKLIVSNGYSCAIQKETIRCWGNNIIGQLGNGEKTISKAGIIKTLVRILTQLNPLHSYNISI